MALTPDYKKHVKSISEDVLNQFERTASVAKEKLGERSSLTSDALAGVNTLNAVTAIRNLRDIDNKNRASYELLSREPSIARILVEDEKGEQQTFYFCRGDQGIPNIGVISYRAPVGRLASLPVGEEFKGPDGRKLYVFERAHLRPSMQKDGWDSRNTVIEGEQFGPLTIESLRALLIEVTGDEITDILGQLLAEETIKGNIIEGLRRGVITKMGLRDQPVLDQYQDEIFRLPLSKRLLILGPPGTGKTTTLIRRLGQKLDSTFLEEDERQLVESINASNGMAHTDSWLMFTPTELLKQYLKEAFAREGVPATDLHIRTWSDYRRELARNAFGVLRTTTSSGLFVLKDGLQSLSADAFRRPTGWYSDFDTWQRDIYFQELRDAASFLNESAMPEVHEIGGRLVRILERMGDGTLASTFAAIATEISNVQHFVTTLKAVSDDKIKGSLNLQLNKDRTFLDKLAQFIDSLQQSVADSDDVDDTDTDEEEEITAQRTGRAAALGAYMQATRAHARAVTSKRSLSKTSRTGKIIEWLGDRTLAEADRLEVGSSLLVQRSARRFTNPVKQYIDGIPKRYRAFRRQHQKDGAWYVNGDYEARDIHPLELDLVLLTILRAAGDLISRSAILREIDSPAWSSLQPFLRQFRNQILVDEATDFSSIQLACMGALTHPRLRSFFACGDFNQRLSTWGVRSTGDLKWVFSDFNIKEITVSYRQSRQLNELARAIIEAVGGTEQHTTLPAHVDSNGVAPALLENAAVENVIIWLANRIREIERFVGQLPSIAIFVNSESEVGPVADALNNILAEHNIQVIACREGQAVGQESNVRVFDIQHIKGLEFEAVFFVAIDRLATLQPELFDKYLYVGITRAATYLGLTCEKTLPVAIESLRAHFCQDWKSPGGTN